MYDLLLAQIDYASAPPFLRLRVLRVPHGSVYRSTVFYAHGPATLASADQEDRRPRHRTAPCRRRAPLRRAVPRAVAAASASGLAAPGVPEVLIGTPRREGDEL